MVALLIILIILSITLSTEVGFWGEVLGGLIL